MAAPMGVAGQRRKSWRLHVRSPPAQALLRSQSGPRAAAWLGTVPSEAGATMPPDRMLIALRRRLRLPLTIAPGRCGAHGPGCGAAVDVYGDHYAACPRTGLLARQPKPLERAWIRVVREAVGPKGKVVPQQWLVRTPAPGVGEALCCDVTLVSPLTRDGRPQPSSTTRDGAALAIAERRKCAAYPELLRRGPQRLLLACEIGRPWNDESLRLVATLVRSRALRAPAPLRGAATQGWYKRWWGLLSVAVQNTLAATLLGSPPVHAPMPGAQAPPLQDVLHDACPPVPSCLPARSFGHGKCCIVQARAVGSTKSGAHPTPTPPKRPDSIAGGSVTH